MMKRLMVIFISVAFAFGPVAPALAGTSDSGPGCGLGKVAWQDSKLGQGVGPQLLMSTTNNTILPFQAFGITTGTLGCKNNGQMWAQEEANIFANLNFDNLSQEMAQGGGEHLASLATLLGVPAEQQPAFFAMTQEKYTTLVQSGETTPAAMLKALHETMAEHPMFAKVSMAR